MTDNLDITEVDFEELFRKKLGSFIPKTGSKGDTLGKLRRVQSLLEISASIINNISYTHVNKALANALEELDTTHRQLVLLGKKSKPETTNNPHHAGNHR
jgi:hypothetical protein